MAMFSYLKPSSMSSPSLHMVVAVVYLVILPTVNPLIYSMRNQELRNAIKKVSQQKLLNSEKITTSLHK